MKRTKRYILLNPGLVEYGKAWALQRRLFFERSRDRIHDVLLLLQHPPVYTFGRRSIKEQPFLVEGFPLQVSIYHVDRGGGATFHGPGQIVGYPILKLNSYTTDYHSYLRMLEEVMIRTLKDFHINSGRRAGYTGVWTDSGKIGSIGIRIVKGVTMHGFSLNVNNDLSFFEWIIPCNLKDVKITSMLEIIKQEPCLDRVNERLVYHFEDVFAVRKIDIHIEMKLSAISISHTTLDFPLIQPPCLQL